MAIVPVIPEESIGSLRTGALSFCPCFLSPLVGLCVPQRALKSEHAWHRGEARYEFGSSRRKRGPTVKAEGPSRSPARDASGLRQACDALAIHSPSLASKPLRRPGQGPSVAAPSEQKQPCPVRPEMPASLRKGSILASFYVTNIPEHQPHARPVANWGLRQIPNVFEPWVCQRSAEHSMNYLLQRVVGTLNEIIKHRAWDRHELALPRPSALAQPTPFWLAAKETGGGHCPDLSKGVCSVFPLCVDSGSEVGAVSRGTHEVQLLTSA